MANENIVTNMEDLFVTLLPGDPDPRVTAFPATGTIVAVEKLSARAVYQDGLHGCSVTAVNGSRGHRVSITVLAGSNDDARLAAIADGTQTTGKVATLSVTYKTQEWVTGSCVVEANPVRNFIADGTEAVTWPLVGSFTIAKIGALVNADVLQQADLST